MTRREWSMGFGQLVIELDADGRTVHIETHELDADGQVKKRGCHAVLGPKTRREVVDFLRPVELFPTRPEDYRRDQYDPRDDREGRR